MGTFKGPVVVKPSTATYRNYVGSGFTVFGGLAVYLVVLTVGSQDSDSGRLWLLILYAVVLGGTLTVMLGYLKCAAVTVTEHEVDAVGFLWHHRRFRPADVARVLDIAGLDLPWSGRRPVAVLVLLDIHGNRLLRLSGAQWDAHGWDAIARATRARVEQLDVVTAKELRRHYPRALKTGEVHPVLFGLLAAIVLLALLVPSVIIYSGSTVSF